MNTLPNFDIKLLISKEAVLFIFLFVVLALSLWVVFLRRERKILNSRYENLLKQSEVDYLTGLGNRRKFYKTLDQKVDESIRSTSKFSLLFIDLDLFKEVNDSFGHATGDLLLGVAAKRICRCIDNEKDFVARIGGDEFIVILSDMYHKKQLNQVAECIRSSLSQLFNIDDKGILVTVSIGITRFPQDAKTTKNLVISGDQAMYHAKKSGRNCYSYFDMNMYIENQYKTNLIRDIRVAIEENQFILHYQPIVDFSNNAIKKVEALIRWKHPERGFVSPADFIPFAEEAGLINSIGNWAFKKAIDDTVSICNQFDKDFQVTINTSPLQYRKNGMNVATWSEYMTACGLSGKNIVVEITEGILMESSQSVTSNLYKLRDQNIDIAIDDFGTGYSSLSYLKKYQVDFLKIDKSFIINMTNDSDTSLVRTIIVMAQKLDIKVIAEGIETETQKDILIAAGCDYGQGFYFSKALSKDDLVTFLNNWES